MIFALVYRIHNDTTRAEMLDCRLLTLTVISRTRCQI